MCTRTIVDANLLSSIKQASFKPIIDWVVKGHGTIVYTDDEALGYYKELKKVPDALDFFISLHDVNQALRITEVNLKASRREFPIDTDKVKSNDQHILELAVAGDVRLLCTNDQTLQKDFMDGDGLPQVKGQPARSIYPVNMKSTKQRHFLDQRKCRRK